MPEYLPSKTISERFKERWDTEKNIGSKHTPKFLMQLFELNEYFYAMEMYEKHGLERHYTCMIELNPKVRSVFTDIPLPPRRKDL